MAVRLGCLHAAPAGELWPGALDETVRAAVCSTNARRRHVRWKRSM